MPHPADPALAAAAPFLTAAADLPPALNVLGERITVLAGAERTGGPEMFHQRGEAGQGPPPHAHGWDETFYVVSGEVEFGAGAARGRIGPGGVAHVPAGVSHWFRFVTDGEIVSATDGAGASKVFVALDAEVPPGPPDFDKVASVILRNGVALG